MQSNFLIQVILLYKFYLIIFILIIFYKFLTNFLSVKFLVVNYHFCFIVRNILNFNLIPTFIIYPKPILKVILTFLDLNFLTLYPVLITD